jgi:hypothetical protein
MKQLKSFSLLVTQDYTYKIGFGPLRDDITGVEFPETNAPILNLNITPMPLICRSKRRTTEIENETYFLLDDPLDAA